VKIGALAKTVCMTAQMGDSVSMDILVKEAEEAAVSVITVADKLGFKNKSFDLIFTGSLFKCEEYFKNILMSRVKEDFPKVNFIPMIKNPVEGAIKLAVQKLKDS